MANMKMRLLIPVRFHAAVPISLRQEHNLGFEPEVGWKQGLKQTIEWYNQYLEAGNKVYE